MILLSCMVAIGAVLCYVMLHWATWQERLEQRAEQDCPRSQTLLGRYRAVIWGVGMVATLIAILALAAMAPERRRGSRRFRPTLLEELLRDGIRDWR